MTSGSSGRQPESAPEWSVIERIWNELDAPYSADPRLNHLTPGQRAIYSLTWIRSEVCNGGFHQCSWNPTGGLLPEAIEGSGLLGAPPWADLLSRAARVFPSPYPRERPRRQELLDQLSEDELSVLDGLDDEFFDLDLLRRPPSTFCSDAT